MASGHIVVLATCATALLGVLVVADAKEAALEDKITPVSVAPATSPRRVVDGVLAMLGVGDVAAPQMDGSDDQGEDTEGTAERGVHKKKILLAAWSAFYWWAWVLAVIVVKFKIALLVIWGHLTYFVVALIRMLIREVPLWIQLKRDPGPAYGPPIAPVYGPAPAPAYGPAPAPAYGPQYGTQSYASPAYKRRTGAVEGTGGSASSTSLGASGHELAYGAHASR